MWALYNMDVMSQLTEDFVDRQPFRGVKIGVCLHLTKETAVLLLALESGGAKLFVCPSNPLSTQDDIVEVLRKSSMMVYTKGRGESMESYVKNLKAVVEAEPDLVIDDGGDLTKEMHASGHVPKYGGLEETTAGVARLRRWAKQGTLKYPIIAVNDTPTKTLFDNVYGTGQSTLDGIMRATNVLLAGKAFVVAGYGHCGKGIAQRARGMGCTVFVTEIDEIKALQAHMDGFEVWEMDAAAAIGDIFVTVTSNINVITKKHFEKMKSGAILANAGHFDVEVDVKGLIEMATIIDDVNEHMQRFQVGGKDIFLLSEGRLVNLAAAEGHPSEVMDMSFANQALSAEYLLKADLEIGVHDVPYEIDKKVAQMKLKALNVYVDKLTKEQFDYLLDTK